MEYLFELEPLTAEKLEQAAGLKLGSIELTTTPEGAVTVRTVELVTTPEGIVSKDSKVALTTDQKDKIKAELAKRGLPKGKRESK